MSEQEFNQRVMIYGNKLLGYSYKLLGNKDDARDVVQDLFYKLWSMRQKLTSVNNIEAFATTVTRNLCIDKLKRGKRNIINFEDISKYHIVDEGNGKNDLEEREIRINRVRLAISKLPELQQKVFIMRDFEEKEFEEIALDLNLSLENARVILSRARQKIRELIVNKND